MDLEEEIRLLKTSLNKRDEEIAKLKRQLNESVSEAPPEVTSPDLSMNETNSLDNESINRYGRQLILPEIGVKGQLKLAGSSVLIVGAGGLGCPAAIYLTAAGVGRLGLVDYDEVELSNLHRQILHTEARVGVSKSASVTKACKQLNSQVTCVPYHLQLDSTNALAIIKQYDIVVDATDNVATRYLLNDACVLSRKPLVSGSALRFEGQLTVYNHEGGPCYRCLYPTPPPAETVTNCSDGGVLGVVPGIIGCLQALEVMKIITGAGTPYHQKLLLFDALDGTFRTIRLRGQQKSCVICGESPSICKLIDYEQFCGARANDKDKELEVLENHQRISVKDYHKMLQEEVPHILVDVRQPVELEICKLPTIAVNIPMDILQNPTNMDVSISLLRQQAKQFKQQHGKPMTVVMVCRRGNDSQMAVQCLQKKVEDSPIVFKDIRGGLASWARKIDPNFPVY